MRREYRFVPVTREDFPMLRSWLAEPHIGGWWGDPDVEIALIDEDLGTGPTDMRIVWFADRPFAYIQDYPAHHWEMPQYAGLPSGSCAVDTFLGAPDFLGQGHASGYIRQRAEELVEAGYAAIAVDPDPENVRAVRAYRKAGFEGDDLRPCEDGDRVLVLLFRDTRR